MLHDTEFKTEHQTRESALVQRVTVSARGNPFFFFGIDERGRKRRVRPDTVGKSSEKNGASAGVT